jgi:hypothetical protein
VFICLGSKYQTTYNEIEQNSEQKLTDSAKSVDWTSEIDKTNKGNCLKNIVNCDRNQSSTLNHIIPDLFNSL